MGSGEGKNNRMFHFILNSLLAFFIILIGYSMITNRIENRRIEKGVIQCLAENGIIVTTGGLTDGIEIPVKTFCEKEIEGHDVLSEIR